jgi:hypothetical protein
MPLDANATLMEIQQRYAKANANPTFNALVLGGYGSGKTRLLRTCRKPILVHSFDPGGSKTNKEFASDPTNGMIVEDRFEKEDPNNPTVWNAWKREMQDLQVAKVFDVLGTYVIDSFSLWSECWSNMYAKMKGRADNIIQLQDYQVFRNAVRDYVKAFTGLPCDFIMTGHLTMEKDEVTGQTYAELMTFKSLMRYVPMLFDEVYVLRSNSTSKGPEYQLLTAPVDRYQARTRIGTDGKFEPVEKPDFKILLEKAGYPAELIH